jgi:hypothetical protein
MKTVEIISGMGEMGSKGEWGGDKLNYGIL